MAASSPQSVLRAALLGLLAGLLLGGLYLIGAAAMTRFGKLDCGVLPPDQCRLEQVAQLDWARLQAIAGGALVLLAAALGLGLRSR